MRNRIGILSGAAALTLAGAIAVATPGYARVHHRTHHQMQGSTAAEKQQTAELNRQQLNQPATAGGGMAGNSTDAGTAPQSTLKTESTGYQSPGTSAPMGNTNGTESPATQGQTTSGNMSNSSGTSAPPPANPAGPSQ